MVCLHRLHLYLVCCCNIFLLNKKLFLGIYLALVLTVYIQDKIEGKKEEEEGEEEGDVEKKWTVAGIVDNTNILSVILIL